MHAFFHAELVDLFCPNMAPRCRSWRFNGKKVPAPSKSLDVHRKAYKMIQVCDFTS